MLRYTYVASLVFLRIECDLVLHGQAFFDVLLTVHLSIFILVINQLDAQNFILQ